MSLESLIVQGDITLESNPMKSLQDGIKTCKCLKGHCAHYQSDFDRFVKGSALLAPQEEREAFRERSPYEDERDYMNKKKGWDWAMENIESRITAREAVAVKAERERINQYFADKADYDTDSDCTIITDRIYHKAFNPEGCSSDGTQGKNLCTACYAAREIRNDNKE